MYSKLLRNLVVTFVVLFVFSFLWHDTLFGNFYHSNMVSIARYSNGALSPLMPYIAFGDLLAIFGFVWFLPKVSSSKSQYVWNGIIMGLVAFGSASIVSHGLFAGWGGMLMVADVAFSIALGALGGFVLSMLNSKAESVSM